MAGSLRDQLSEAFTEVEQETVSAPATEGPGSAGVSQEAPTQTAKPEAETVSETPEQKAGRTAGRARDEHGRLLPGPAKKDSAAPQNTATPIRAPEQAGQPVAAETVKPKVPRPSSWKKDHWEGFDKLAETNPALAQYINQRESEFAQGVSTYKAEWDRAKPLLDAVAPFQGVLQQYKLDPAQHIQKLLGAHQQLALGTPEQRLSMFAQLAKDYQIDLGQMFVKGQDGQIYLNPQLQQAAQQRPQQQPQQDVRKTVQELLAEERAAAEVERIKSDTEKYPHFAVVMPTMVGLLQSGLATTYDEAYTAAIRHPKHSDIFEAQQQQQRQQDEQRAADERRKAAEAARRNAFSPRTSTPTAAAAGTNGKKGLRDVITEAVDSVGGGRV